MSIETLMSALTEYNIDTYIKTYLLVTIGAYSFNLYDVSKNKVKGNSLKEILMFAILLSMFLISSKKQHDIILNNYSIICVVVGICNNTLIKFIMNFPKKLDQVINKEGFAKDIIRKWLKL